MNKTDSLNDVTDRDWVQDFSHENGNYLNHCTICSCNFKGHKRRVVCKACSVPKMSEPPIHYTDALEHLAWLKKTANSTEDNCRIIGFEDCLRVWKESFLHTDVNHHVQSGISVVSHDYLERKIAEKLEATTPIKNECWTNYMVAAHQVMETIKPFLRTDKPVSLQACARVASQWLKGANMGEPTWDRLSYTQRAAYVQQTRAILTSAGVPFTDEGGE